MAYIGSTPGFSTQRIVTTFTATGGQTSFSPTGGYVLNYVDVYYNGVRLVAGDDFSATNGTSVTLTVAASAGDVVEIVSYVPRGLSDGYTKLEADALYLRLTGGTLTGNLGIGTTSPTTYPLQVRRAGGAGSLGISIDGVGGTDRAVQYFAIQDSAAGVGSGHAFYYRAPSSTTDTLGVLLDEGGNVGIGTSSPAYKLVVSAAGASGLEFGPAYSGTANLIQSYNRSGAAYVDTVYDAAQHRFNTSGSEKVRIDTSGNVGIGTSSPAAKLDVTGIFNGTQAVFGNTPGRGLLIGTALNGGTNEATIVLNARGAGAGRFLFQTDGTDRMVLDLSGNLGLGVTPSASNTPTLQLPNNVTLSGGGTAASLAQNAFYSSVWKYASTAAASLYQGYTGNHAWYTAASGTAGNTISWTQAMTLDASGNLGVGTTSPSTFAKSAIVAATGSNALYAGTGTQGIFISADNTSRYVTYNASGNLSGGHIWQNGNTEFMRLDLSGNLGIGTADPSANKLVVAGNANIGDGTNRTPNANWGGHLNITGNGYTGGLSLDGTAMWVGHNSDSRALILATNETERVRIDGSGNVGIGTSSPSQKLDVVGGRSYFASASDNYAIGVRHNSSLSGIHLGSDSGGNFVISDWGGATRIKMFATTGKTLIAGTTDNGSYNLQCLGTGVWGAGAYVNGSDERLKDDITTLNDGLNVVSQLRPVTFKYKPDYSKDQNVQTGFIAQELQAVLAGKDYVDGVVQAGPEHLNVAYQSLIPILVKAIQELTARVAELEAR
jgi:hypothetical protein